ncbi:MAG TPA: protein translocase subunit SecD [Dehalococcoidia bacterium]
MRIRFNHLALLGILLLTAAALYAVWPGRPDRYLPGFIPWPEGRGVSIGGFHREEMRLGLDLRGGTNLVLEAEPSADVEDLDQALDGAMEIIERRINAFGVAESEVTRVGEDRISVAMPGVTADQAFDQIGRTAELQFMEPLTDAQGNVLTRQLTPDGSGFEIVPIPRRSFESETSRRGPEFFKSSVLWKPVTGEVDGRHITLTGRYFKPNAQVRINGADAEVLFEFNATGAEVFEQATTRLKPTSPNAGDGLPIGIFLDATFVDGLFQEDGQGQFISAPFVRDTIRDNGVITGNSPDEARQLAKQLNIGALPVRLNVVQQQEVDATLGDETVRNAVIAGEVALGLVVLFMVLYYRLPGLLASLALVTYTALVLAVFKLWPVTLTLAGIAAFVLSVGMAVDANILIFERLREELRAGKSLRVAVDAGFSRAWSSIRDSNVSTLITCAILYWFGEQFGAALVKGFALTLAIGVVVSMFSAITVTRTYLHAIMGARWARSLWLYGVRAADREAQQAPAARPRAIDFVHRRWLYFGLSALVAVPGMVGLLLFGLKPGIEFTSGTTFTVAFQDQGVSVQDVQHALADLGHPEARVQRTSGGAFLVRTDEFEGQAQQPEYGPAPPSEREAVEQGLQARLGPLVDREGNATNRFQDFNTVSPIVSGEVVRNAALAVLAATVAILLYISWAFRSAGAPFRYGVAAVLALAHDVVVVLGTFAILGEAFQMEVNAMFITALLTVIGFSVHDTIVVFDRIREHARRPGAGAFGRLVNDSLQETLGRSVNTSLTVVFVLVAMLALAGGSISSFLWVLLIGIVCGTYSSIFIASQILVVWHDGDVPRLFRRLLGRGRRAEEAVAPS